MIPKEQYERSIWDVWDKLENPSAQFAWDDCTGGGGFKDSEIIVEGWLQEVDVGSSLLHSQKYYAASKENIYKFTCKDVGTPLEVLRLPFPRLKFYKDQVHWKYGICLTAHEVVRRFAANTKEEAVNWYKKLREAAQVSLLHFSQDYDIGKELKRGSYYKVHTVVRTDTKNHFVAKSILKKILIEKRQLLTELGNGIRVSRLVPHRALLKIHEVFEAEQYVHIVMEYFNGKELFTKLRSRPSLTEKEVGVIMRELLGVVDCLHEAGVIHRDLKPENLFLLSGRQLLKITNCDLAIISKGTLEKQVCGTYGFVAPEILRKQGYSFKADIFSCGILLYCLLTGASPFAGGTAKEVREKNCLGEILYPKELWEQVSEEGRDLVMQMTMLDQYKRPNAKACLAHKWFSVCTSNTKKLEVAIKNIHKYGVEKGVQDLFSNAKKEVKEELHCSSPLLLSQGTKLGENSPAGILHSASSLPRGTRIPAIFRKELEKCSPVPDWPDCFSAGTLTLHPSVSVDQSRFKEAIEEEPEIPEETESTDSLVVNEFSVHSSNIKGLSEIHKIPITPGIREKKYVQSAPTVKRNSTPAKIGCFQETVQKYSKEFFNNDSMHESTSDFSCESSRIKDTPKVGHSNFHVVQI